MKTKTFITVLIIVLVICLDSCKDSHDYRKQWTGKYHFVETLRDSIFREEGDLYVRVVELEVNKVAIYWKENDQLQHRICTVEPDGTVCQYLLNGGVKGQFGKKRLVFTEEHLGHGGTVTYQYDCKKIKDK